MEKLNSEELQIPGTELFIHPEDKVKLGRFSDKVWIVRFGWFSYANNRPFCGWFFESPDGKDVKPIQLPDLSDIYLIES